MGIGLVGAGVFPADPINGYPPGTPDRLPQSDVGELHDLFSTPVFTALPAAALVLGARFARAGEPGLGPLLARHGGAFWVCFVLAVVGFNGVPALVPTGGLWQRLSITIGFLWLAAGRAPSAAGTPRTRDPMIVRDATAADAAGCAAIYAPYVRETTVSFELEPPTPEQMAERIATAQARHAWLVLEEDGRVVGYAYANRFSARPAYRWSVEVSIYLDRDRHRAVAAGVLYEALLERLAERGYRRAMAGMSLPNDASVAFHRALGFEPVGVYRRVGWKHGAWRDVAWVQRTIRDAADPPHEPQ